MAKRMQEQEGEDRIVAKSKPTTMNLAFVVSTSSSTVQNPVASKRPGIRKAPCRTDGSSTGKPDAKEHNHDAASSSQGWQKDTVLDVGTRKLVASGNSDKVWPHSLHISTNYVLHMEKVFSIVRRCYGFSPMDQMKNLDVNTAIWGILRSVDLQAAVHLGKDCTEKLDRPKVTQRLITDQTEITGLTTIDWQQPMWRETTLLTDRAVQFATARRYVFSDSAMSWKARLNGFWKHVISTIWIVSKGNNWNSSGNFPGFTTLGILEEIQKFMIELHCEPEQFEGKIIFMSMYNDIFCRELGNTEKCETISVTNANYARRFPLGRWSFLGPGSEKKWYGTCSGKPDGKWDKTAERMMQNFAEGGHPIWKQRKGNEIHSLQR